MTGTETGRAAETTRPNYIDKKEMSQTEQTGKEFRSSAKWTERGGQAKAREGQS